MRRTLVQGGHEIVRFTDGGLTTTSVDITALTELTVTVSTSWTSTLETCVATDVTTLGVVTTTVAAGDALGMTVTVCTTSRGTSVVSTSVVSGSVTTTAEWATDVDRTCTMVVSSVVVAVTDAVTDPVVESVAVSDVGGDEKDGDPVGDEGVLFSVEPDSELVGTLVAEEGDADDGCALPLAEALEGDALGDADDCCSVLLADADDGCWVTKKAMQTMAVRYRWPRHLKVTHLKTQMIAAPCCSPMHLTLKATPMQTMAVV
ncbi:hypothetical protein DFQ27_007921 [Actinomortierella ambigua]|uniref:Uncharacterized protein n=1 Tax=Actinomortierella ambigua TaxID=1343610 RepID=A0A9P6TZ23_9FUNG|nr:hypothetical protein DFQ27_007921 [Actinomortierella ambigua]